LSIGNNIVKNHGGLMRIDSREGICTKVFIELPEYKKL
jgi:signal transduction histidine kinase